VLDGNHLPDYLFRRYAQGKRFGHEITLYSVWFELRWGITACLILTVLLITMIFYFHPSTKNAVSFFRTVPLLPEGSGRVEEIYVSARDKVKAGQPIFKLDSSKQEAALETARRRIAEIDAAMEQAKVELEAADGKIQEAQGAYQQAVEELETKRELQRRNASTVALREIERLENVVEADRAAFQQPSPTRSPSRLKFHRSCRHRKPAPRPRARRPRSTSTRPSSTPLSMA
jgi:multidrug resistance efflux pump